MEEEQDVVLCGLSPAARGHRGAGGGGVHPEPIPGPQALRSAGHRPAPPAVSCSCASLLLPNRAKLVKTAELPPNQNYVLGSHPHGIMCMGMVCNFMSECNDFSRRFPGLQPWITTLVEFFYLPVFRDYLLAAGLRPVSRHSLDFVLSQPQLGQAVVIVIGGGQELLSTSPGQHFLKLLNRKGFVRLALRHGASLVPTYSFGENDVFNTKTFPEGSWLNLCQVVHKRIIGFSPCVFWGRSIFLPNSWGLLPHPRPITTVVGAPIHVPQLSAPTEEQVDHYHRLYMEALERLFEEHKESCGISASTHLNFR
ncbi:2-acylglycerol O-acyltransferase 3-like [Ochotona princeps]|uniref:2-acylglycerol O-acyltransferase 3-like n=1 Tax=Ochotona princeps TaxID=9978 RepID=UPI002714A3A2|nr:2-acylglycerol O-acyltransferase 3-like [Ochotona princeps]